MILCLAKASDAHLYRALLAIQQLFDTKPEQLRKSGFDSSSISCVVSSLRIRPTVKEDHERADRASENAQETFRMLGKLAIGIMAAYVQ